MPAPRPLSCGRGELAFTAGGRDRTPAEGLGGEMREEESEPGWHKSAVELDMSLLPSPG